MRYRRFVTITAAVTAMAGVWTGGWRVKAQGSAPTALIGAWTLNRDLSDSPQDRAPEDRDRGDEQGSGRRSRGGFGGGGFGGGRRGGGGGRGGAGGRVAGDPEQIARVRDAMRDIMNPPEHLTIVQTENMIILTGPDGRTTRLSPNGKKIKDDATKIERKTTWDGGKLVSEITGLASNKFIESYSVDPERHQLRLTVQSDNDRRPMTIHRVYDADAR
jgi:hypothetical protein